MSHITEEEKELQHLAGFWSGGDPNSWCPEVWDYLIKLINPKSIVDLGCGEGYSTTYFKEKNIPEVLGIDGSPKAIKSCILKGLTIIAHDFSKGELNLRGSYDLCWCSEFVEHIDEEYMKNFLQVMKSCKMVAMTHAFPEQPGWNHVNCKPREYWVKIMEENGFTYFEKHSEELRALTSAIHINRSLLLFKRTK